MAEFIIMPKLGFNMDEGELVRWVKAEGDTVKKGDVVFEIQTDKTVMEVESSQDGVLLKVLVEEGRTVPVILPVGIIGVAGEDVAAMVAEAAVKLAHSGTGGGAEAAAIVEETAAPVEVPSAAVSGNLKLTPRARKYAGEQGLDLSEVSMTGTGFQNGITQKDLEAQVKAGKITPLAKKMAQAAQVDISGISGSGIGGKIVKEDILAAKQSAAAGGMDDIEILHVIDYKGMRKVIGDRLSESKFTAPHLYFTTSVDVSELIKFRDMINKSQSQKVSFNDFVIVAAANALQKYPEINCSLRGDKIVQFKDVNIGMAVGMENGLIVPVVKKAQNKKLTAIAAETAILAEKARSGKLLAQEYQGGTFTVSNLGMFGIENFTAIINPPEAAILSVSAMQKTPVVNGENEVVVRTVMKMTVSVDHRLIDGMKATRFLNEIKALLEQPLTILI